jgi:hypothetical protein
VARKPAVVFLVQNRRNLSRRNLSPLHSSLALSASFKIYLVPRERVLRAVITLQRSASCSLETLLQQKHETLLSSQNPPVSELREKRVTCRARLLLVGTAPSSDLSLEISSNARARLSNLHATPRSFLNIRIRGRAR